MNRLTVYCLACILFLFNDASGQINKQQLRNLTAFSKLYGYVRFYHPADEAKLEFWPSIAVYCIQRMLIAKDDSELVFELNNIFKKIAPTVSISKRKTVGSENHFAKIIPIENSNLRTIAWQHSGFNLYSSQQTTYKSIRLNRKAPAINDDQTEVILLENIDISNFRDLPFILSIRLKSSRDNVDETIDIDLIPNKGKPQIKGDSSKAFIADATAKTVSLKSKFNSLSESFNLSLKISNGLNLEIENVDLEVLKEASRVAVPLKKFHLPKNSSQVQNTLLDIKDIVDKPLYPEHAEVGDVYMNEIVKNIYCTVPLALYGDFTNTFPIVDAKVLDQFREDIKMEQKYKDNNAGDFLEVRLANIVIMWNVFKHSFPYWKSASKTADQLLNDGLVDASRPQSAQDFLEVIKRFCVPLNDGHIFVDFYDGSHRRDTLTIPVEFTTIENRVIVKDILDSTLLKNISPGDMISAINGIDAFKHLKNVESLISGSPQWRRFKSAVTLGNGPENRPVFMSYSHHGQQKMIELKRNLRAATYRPGSASSITPATGWLKPDIYYFNLTKDTLKTEHLPLLQSARIMIFDMRGYPVTDRTFELIGHLLKEERKIKRFYSQRNWWPDLLKVDYIPQVETIKPLQPHLGGKAIFLIDASAQSASETFLSAVKAFNLGVLVGTATSGANGNLNTFFMPGKYRVTYTGMLTKNPDGSDHHTIGIKPDIIVHRSHESFLENYDNVLQHALKLY